MTQAPTNLLVLPGPDISDLLAGSEREVAAVVRAAYLAHERGEDHLPHSTFVRLPDRPEARVIALPGRLGDVAGMKWISSYPRNHDIGLPRASAVLVLNDSSTGFPVALLEGAVISAARTAASAAVAAHALGGTEAVSVGVVGAGPIARATCRYAAAMGVGMHDVRCHDLDVAAAKRFAVDIGDAARVTGLTDALDTDLVIFATTAAEPYVPVDVPLRAGQLLLNISLRDLPAAVVLRTDNVVDDIDHCLRERTSPDLAELASGGRDFVTGTLGEILTGAIVRDKDRPVVFSPFGLGVLDLAVGSWVLRAATARGTGINIRDFHSTERA